MEKSLSYNFIVQKISVDIYTIFFVLKAWQKACYLVQENDKKMLITIFPSINKLAPSVILKSLQS